MRSDQPTGGDVDVAVAADDAEATPEPAAEHYPAGARIHQAVQAIRGTPTPQPVTTERPPPARITASEPRPTEPDPTMDLFGASASAPESAEKPAEPQAVESGPGGRTAPPAAADDLVVDLRSAAVVEPIPATATLDVTDTRTWADAPQGWVRNPEGGLDWHPVITASDRFDRWEIDIPLGLVAVDVMLFGAVNGERIALGRRDAIGEIVAETLRRGGHAVVSVSQHVTQLDGSLLVTVAGTAVTLRDRAHA